MSYRWIKGATAVMSLRVKSGTVAGTETIRCALKKNASSGSFSLGAASEILVLTPSFVAASGDEPARWDFTATADQTAALPVGDYVMDARLVIAGQVMQTDRVPISVVDRVTGAG